MKFVTLIKTICTGIIGILFLPIGSSIIPSNNGRTTIIGVVFLVITFTYLMQYLSMHEGDWFYNEKKN